MKVNEKARSGRGESFAGWSGRLLREKRQPIVKAVIEIGDILDRQNPNSAGDAVARLRTLKYVKLFDLGYVAIAVSIFHQQGDNFRFAWNKFWQGEEWALGIEVLESKRVYNPYHI